VLAGGGREVGFVTSVTRPFCADCRRMRLSADGRLYTCLFASCGRDVQGPLRAGATDDEIGALLRATWGAREDRYSERRPVAAGATGKVEMSVIGG
jgi:cyclic pyranopterin phosphate synthase